MVALSPRAIRLCLAISAAALFALADGRASADTRESGDAASAHTWHAPLSDGAALSLPDLGEGVPSPHDFLGYSIGERFTPAHRVADYLETLAASSDRARLWSYGESYEGRPLQLMAISSASNIEALEGIRERHLARLDSVPRESSTTTGPLNTGLESSADPAFVWLSYGVHGNESSSTEAAMAAAYVLLAAETEAWNGVLERVVVLLDPLTNPDGRERYVHHYKSRSGRSPDPYREAAEHREPWPSGRQNHYGIDLNRDWIWLSQVETQHRVREYRRWEPHVFVDLHEMSPDSSYFFPPSAAPVHPLIDDRTVEWLETFGKANAAAFEQQGWLFYTGEQYDLFYPGYGDSYPALRQSVGMTYEMAGSGVAGLSLRRRTGNTLRLADRTARHLTTSLSTVRTAAEKQHDLIHDQASARAEAARGSDVYLWSPREPHAEAAVRLLAGHGITVQRLAQPWTTSATPPGGGDPIQREFEEGTYLATAGQGTGNLVRTLFELEAELDPRFIEAQRERVEGHRDAQFFDITAWSLPLAYDFEVWKTDRAPSEPIELVHDADSAGSIVGEGDFGYIVPAAGLATFRAAASLQRHRISYRQLQPHSAMHGALFVARRDLGSAGESTIAAIAASSGVTIQRVASGYGEDGVPFGSEEHPPVRHSRIGLVLGEGVSAYSFGHLWHLLDQTIEAEYHQIRIQDLTGTLTDLDVAIFPDGKDYSGRLDADAAGRIRDWVEGGGVIVAINQAAVWLREHGVLTDEEWSPSEDSGTDPTRLVPGAIVQTDHVAHHPLFAGLDHPPSVLFQGDDIWPPTGDPKHDLLVASEDNPVIAGFAWPESKEALAGALLVGDFPVEEGRVVVFSQDPAFRLFWRATMPLFLNAVLHGPSWP